MSPDSSSAVSDSVPKEGLQLQSTVTKEGQLDLRLESVAVPEPGEFEVTVRVEAAPINPSDLGLLTGPADLDLAVQGGTPDRPTISAPIPEKMLGSLAARFDQKLGVGNEGAGIVVAAGASGAAQAMLGRTVAFVGGESYSEYRTLALPLLLPHQDGTTPREAASSFVNPLTALGMVETMRREGHSALVHTAAASNLGQMLVKICDADGVDLVNIVRRPAQAELLRKLGAKFVCDSSDPEFKEELISALVETGATIAFDATGGGRLAGQILGCMETALNRQAENYSRYGSDTHKQVYLYGRLDTSETVLGANFGMAWGVGGWLLTPFLASIGADAARLRDRVTNEIRTTFASDYTAEVSLAGALDLENLRRYQQKTTGEKFLICPQQ